MKLFRILLALFITLSASTAFAWDWTCSPKETTTIEQAPPPQINLMVDKSGSMWGSFARACKVCETNGRVFEVSSASQCQTNGWSLPAQRVELAQRSTSRYPRYDFSFDNLPNASTFNIRIAIQGDYASWNEYADVYANGVWIGRVRGGSDCSGLHRETLTINRNRIPNNGGRLQIRVTGSRAVSTWCGENNTTVSIDNSTTAYYGTTADSAVCGRISKWDSAKNAIQNLTTFSDSQNPELAHFGLGLFTGGYGYNVENCRASNSARINQTMNSNNPGGGTPTAHAILTSLNGQCLENASTRTSATVLINDGAPTTRLYTSATTYNARTDAIKMACLHRQSAPLYVVGLGGGTDVLYNDVLAAAGGTGTCQNDVDPCDNFASWGNLRGTCTGSIQTSNENELTLAIAGITTELGCTYRVNFQGSIVTAVPEDGTGEYEYLYVDYFDVTQGQYVRIYHQDSTLATNHQGWTFSDNQREMVKFSPNYCNWVQSGRIVEASTQLACLCEEQTDSECNVPNAAQQGLCPTGTWQCTEGVDWCEPATDCCVDGEACTIPGAVGICAAGVTQCPRDSGYDGPIATGDATFQFTSSNPRSRYVPHILDSISIVNTVFSDFIVPSRYAGAFASQHANVYLTENNRIVSRYRDPGNWNAKALPAFRSRNLNYYQGNDSGMNDGVDHYALHYDTPILVTEGRFIAVTERYLNNPVDIRAFDASGTPLGDVHHVLTSHYLRTGHIVNYGQEIGIAVYALDDIAPVGTKIASIKLYPLSFGGGDAADGKVFIFGDGDLHVDPNNLDAICVPVNEPEDEICDGLDNDCDGFTDEIDDPTCTVPGQFGRCAAGALSCNEVSGVYSTVCNQIREPMPELCDGLDNDCNGAVDDIVDSWERQDFQIHKVSMTSNEDLSKACVFKDVCICNNDAKDNHAGTDFASFIDEWDPACMCGSSLEEAEDTLMSALENHESIESENADDSTLAGCSTTHEGPAKFFAFILLGLFFMKRRK